MQNSDGDSGTFIAGVIAICGAQAADALISAVGGRRIYVPRTPQSHHKIVQIIGLDAACALGAERGGEFGAIPNGKYSRQRDEFVRLLKQGLSARRIAERTGVTTRAVYLAKARLKRAGVL